VDCLGQVDRGSPQFHYPVWHVNLAVPLTQLHCSDCTHVTRWLLCICKAGTDLVVSDEACIVLAAVAVPKVDSWHRQVMQVLAEVDLCGTYNIFVFSVWESDIDSDTALEDVPCAVVTLQPKTKS
jgi:hypothetical protein